MGACAIDLQTHLDKVFPITLYQWVVLCILGILLQLFGKEGIPSPKNCFGGLIQVEIPRHAALLPSTLVDSHSKGAVEGGSGQLEERDLSCNTSIIQLLALF